MSRLEGIDYVMEGGVNEPLETQYRVLNRTRCTAQQEKHHEECFRKFPVAVDEIVYPRDEWRDPIKRFKKELLPPWIPHEVAGTGWGRSRGATQHPSVGFVMDH